MIEYTKATLTDDVIKQLIVLSKRWVEEDCSFGMRANTKEDLKEPLYIAKDGDQIVGYIFGHFYIKENKTSYIEVGSQCFEIDELYVLPSYRNKAIGTTLFKMLEEEVMDKADYITLASSTKDYKKILKFYVEDNDMTFHSAYMIKKCK